MNQEIPFEPALIPSHLIMGQCGTRRSIISAVSQIRKKKLDTFENKKWVVKSEGGDSGGESYYVTCKETGIKYFVKAFYVEYGFYWGPVTYSVYKKVSE